MDLSIEELSTTYVSFIDTILIELSTIKIVQCTIALKK